MKAHLNLSTSGCMWLELQAEGVAEHQMLNHWAYRCQVHGVYAGQQDPGGNQMVLRDGLSHPAVPPSRPGVGSYSVPPQGAPDPAAAPKCSNRACAEWRTVLLDHLRACGVFSPQVLAEATATLRPGPDGVPLTVDPETVTPGQPIQPGVIRTQAAEPEPADHIVRALAAADPNFRGHDPQHECSLCGVLGARTPEGHKPTCPWRMARAWVA